MKTVTVKVVPNAKKNSVSICGEKLKVYVKSPAVDGKANKMLIEVLSDFFKVKKRDITIIRGVKSREKIVEINK